MPHNKFPGNDGLTKEIFWVGDDIKYSSVFRKDKQSLN